MKTAVYCLILLLSIYPLSGYGRMQTYDEQPIGVAWDVRYGLGKVENEHRITKDNQIKDLTPMEALDLVKSRFASNFEKIEVSKDEYYYKLDLADYYLVFEGKGETEQQYLFHLYEFVQDEAEGGIGHTVTYGWYNVDKVTGEIFEVQL